MTKYATLWKGNHHEAFNAATGLLDLNDPVTAKITVIKTDCTLDNITLYDITDIVSRMHDTSISKKVLYHLITELHETLETDSNEYNYTGIKITPCHAQNILTHFIRVSDEDSLLPTVLRNHIDLMHEMYENTIKNMLTYKNWRDELRDYADRINITIV